jgi:choice-of-anchor B domain-containing protein
MRVLVAFASIVPTLASAQHDELVLRAVQPSPRHSGEEYIAFDADGIHLRGWVPITAFPGNNTSANDCWGYVSPSGREYALLGLSGGTGFVEVTDPRAPTIVSFQPGPVHPTRCVKTYADHAYSASEGGGGIQVFDLGAIDSGMVAYVGSVTAGGFANTHTIAVDEVSGFLYRAGSGNGLHVYDLANPGLPTYVGTWSSGYVHECQVVTWDVPGPYLGRQIGFCYMGSSRLLRIIDLTDKGAITEISSFGYPGASYAHQGWTSADKRYVYLDDEQDDATFGPARTRIIDISDLGAPTYVGDFASGSVTTDHNLYVKGDRIYEANYSAGLQVFDASDPLAPVLVGHFDTAPEIEELWFTSLWSNYPLLPSGTLLGGDMQKGLFVWGEGAPALEFAWPGGEPDLLDPLEPALKFTVTERVAGTLVPGTVRVHASTGGAFVAHPAWPISGDLFRADLPNFPCAADIDVYLSASTVDGVTWTHPPAAPTQAFRMVVGYDHTVTLEDDMESDAGWSVNDPADLAGSTPATTGTWVRADPVGSFGAQSEDDHTPYPGSQCWFTGQGTVGGPIGEADVDGGTTSLRSPLLDATGLGGPRLSYWRWYSNSTGSSPAEDTLTVHLSSDGGATWVLARTIGPNGPDTLGGWIREEIPLSEHIMPTRTVRVLFVVSDLGSGSIVEAAIDDLQLLDYECVPDTVSVDFVAPAEGPAEGGNWVTIHGSSFDATTQVHFGGRAALAVNALDHTTLQALVPPARRPVGGKLGQMEMRADVRVSSPGLDTLPKGYRYVLSTRHR